MESIESLAVESIDEFDIEYEKRFPTNTTTTQSYDQFVKKNEEIRRWCDNWFATHGG